MCEVRDGRPMRSGEQDVIISMPPFQIFDLTGGNPELGELRTKFLVNAGEGEQKCVDIKASKRLNFALLCNRSEAT